MSLTAPRLPLVVCRSLLLPAQPCPGDGTCAARAQPSSRSRLHAAVFAPLPSRRCLRAVVSSCAISTLADKGRLRRKDVLFFGRKTPVRSGASLFRGYFSPERGCIMQFWARIDDANGRIITSGQLSVAVGLKSRENGQKHRFSRSDRYFAAVDLRSTLPRSAPPAIKSASTARSGREPVGGPWRERPRCGRAASS